MFLCEIIPKPSIITLPTASIVLLTSFSLFLIGIQNYANDVGYDDLPLLFENLLDRNIELSLFIVSSSLVIPRFISNIEIRHSYFWLYFVPIIIIIFFFFGSYFNFSDVYGIMVE